MASPALTTDMASIGDGSQPTRTWARSHGMYLAGRASIDEADLIAQRCERRWGAGRLRLLVSVEMREKFDRQRYLFNQAIWHGDLEAVKLQSRRMVAAWTVLDKTARDTGAQPLDLDVWETVLSDGSIAAIVRDAAVAHRVAYEDRRAQVYTLDEIGRLLDAYPAIAKAKAAFPGATVTAIRTTISDPLDAVADTKDGLDDDLPF